MAPPPKPWFRFYCEAVHDRKLRRLTPAQRWVWVAVLCAARQSPKPGFLLVGDEPMNVDDLADIAAVSSKETAGAVRAFLAAGMLEDGFDGVWQVVAWEKRQYESDRSTTRTRKHRKGDGASMERPIAGNGTVIQGRWNADVAPPESETETETDAFENLLEVEQL